MAFLLISTKCLISRQLRPNALMKRTEIWFTSLSRHKRCIGTGHRCMILIRQTVSKCVSKQTSLVLLNYIFRPPLVDASQQFVEVKLRISWFIRVVLVNSRVRLYFYCLPYYYGPTLQTTGICPTLVTGLAACCPCFSVE